MADYTLLPHYEGEENYDIAFNALSEYGYFGYNGYGGDLTSVNSRALLYTRAGDTVIYRVALSAFDSYRTFFPNIPELVSGTLEYGQDMYMVFATSASTITKGLLKYADTSSNSRIETISFESREINNKTYLVAPRYLRITRPVSNHPVVRTGLYDNLTPFTSINDILTTAPYIVDRYSITYHYTNSTVSGPSEAAVGDTVVVSAVPDVDYGITDASSQISVTNDDVAVPYTWDAANQRITFTMPQPAENRGGFGSTGQ